VITDHLAELIASALAAASRDGIVSGDMPEPFFERPRKREHGDWATNVALQAAKGGNPRPIAQAIVDRLPPSDVVARVDVAGPGFLNFHLAPVWLHDVVRRAATDANFGRSDRGRGTKVNVEYVSANPTGPLSVVAGRHAAVGDALANLFEATGYDVDREYYFNDAGRQLQLFRQSIHLALASELGIRVEMDIPEGAYSGDYLIGLAQLVVAEAASRYDALADVERVERLADYALARTQSLIQESLNRFGTEMDIWTSERRDLHDTNVVNTALGRLANKGLLYERDEATWFKSSAFGDEKDRVVIRSNGEPTYLAGDMGYLLHKSDRGYDALVYLWGADHHGTVGRLKAAAEALDLQAEVEIVLVQNVSLVRGEQRLKASKRSGVFVPLDDLIRDVGPDAARYTFLTRSIDVPLDFDIELAKEQAPENPVYYVQYAHARICSILRKAADEGHQSDPAATLEPLTHESEDTLMRKLASYEEVVPESAEMRAPQRITRFVEELASDFSAFYRDCRVITEDERLTKARLALCVATKNVIASGLGLLGVSAPERM